MSHGEHTTCDKFIINIMNDFINKFKNQNLSIVLKYHTSGYFP